MSSIPKTLVSVIKKIQAMGPEAAFIFKKFRYPLYGLLGVFLIMAIFYVLTILDPNTLVNSKQGFETFMDLTFGPDQWRADSYSYNYRDRTMTVNGLWVSNIAEDTPASGQLLVFVNKLTVSHLTWAKDFKALLTGQTLSDSLNPLAAKVVATEVSFLRILANLRIHGRLARIDLQNLRFIPGNMKPFDSPAAGGRFDFLRRLQPDRLELEKVRLSGTEVGWPFHFTLSLPSWNLTEPRLTSGGLVTSEGSVMGGLGFAVNLHGYNLSGRIDELAHDGLVGPGYFDRLAVRNLNFWLEPKAGPTNLDRIEKKNLDPAVWELALADGVAQYLDLRSVFSRFFSGFSRRGGFSQAADLLNLLTVRTLSLGGATVFDSSFSDLSVTYGGLTGRIGRGELAVTAGRDPYALSVHLVDGWYRLHDPQDPAKPFWSDIFGQADDLNFLTGRFNFSGQAGYDPQKQLYLADGSLEMTNLFGLSVGLELGGVTGPLIETLERVTLKDLLIDKTVTGGLNDISLQLFEAQLRDQGLVEGFINYYGRKTEVKSPDHGLVHRPESGLDQTRDRIIFGLALALTLKLEKYLVNSQTITNQVAVFIRQPGILTLKAVPSPAISYRGYQSAASLGDLLESANLSLSLDSEGLTNFQWKNPWPISDGPYEELVDWHEGPDKLTEKED